VGLLVTQYTTRVNVPDSDEWMDIRPLSWAELEGAEMVAAVDAVKAAKALDIENVLGGASEDDIKAVIERQSADPLAQLDIFSVLRAGIVAWSIDAEVSPENIKLLEPSVARWAALQIVGLRSREDLGNSSSPSTPS
jgi:hypothetical protein